MSVSIQSSAFSTPTDVTVNGVSQGQIPANFPIDVNLTDYEGNPQDGDISLAGSNLAIQTKWWNRPEEWLPMPTITAADNKFAGLYAVFEDGFNAVAILLNNGNHSITWGDGTTSSGSGASQTYDHVYNYATISGAVLVSDDGRNYKQVLVEVDYDLDTSVLRIDSTTTPTTGTNTRPQNWLDVSISSTHVSNLATQVSSNSSYTSTYLQRLLTFGNVVLSNTIYCTSLRILKYDFTAKGNILLTNLGDVRDENGNPIVINSSIITTSINMFSGSSISKIGDITLTGITANTSSMFTNNFSLESVGDFNHGNSVFLSALFQNCNKLRSLGMQTTSASNTSFASTFSGCGSLTEIIFAGTCSGVTTTTNAFGNCISLRRLILPGLTRGFDIRVTQITGTNLQDLFTSLGTAAGAQTITLSLFTIGQDTSIATVKGYTIAYA